jgi:hypothetical protein
MVPVIWQVISVVLVVVELHRTVFRAVVLVDVFTVVASIRYASPISEVTVALPPLRSTLTPPAAASVM